MDGHGSHITANVISFCIETAIDLLILPPHASRMLQPLDVSVFALLKQALAAETDAASDWILAAHNVLSGLQCIFAHERRPLQQQISKAAGKRRVQCSQRYK